MSKSKKSRWVWYAVLAAVLVGLFAPTMVAQAAKLEAAPTCRIPKV
jgi:hypothetical protein